MLKHESRKEAGSKFTKELLAEFIVEIPVEALSTKGEQLEFKLEVLAAVDFPDDFELEVSLFEFTFFTKGVVIALGWFAVLPVVVCLGP